MCARLWRERERERVRALRERGHVTGRRGRCFSGSSARHASSPAALRERLSQRARAPSRDDERSVDDCDDAMSREVELERPARVEQPRERVLQKPAAPNGPELGGDNEEEVLLEKEEQCVCQICTCG